MKDYGIIAQITSETSGIQTGFILNDHKLSSKYKPGQSLKCRVLDIDYSKKIADLKELSDKTSGEVVIKASSKKAMKPEHKTKAIVELNKEGYLVVSVKSSRSTLGLCIHSNLN